MPANASRMARYFIIIFMGEIDALEAMRRARKRILPPLYFSAAGRWVISAGLLMRQGLLAR